jgi:citrate lyase subunit beta/citryl-CoA lyase
MSATNGTVVARSWLFTPGNSIRKLERAITTAADIILIDLEDSVKEGEKAAARETAAAFAANHVDQRTRLWFRINSLHGPHALRDLVKLVPTCPGGLMLPKARGRCDLETLDHYLSALETAAGAEPGSTKVCVVATETPQSMFAIGNYQGSPRLAAMTWGAEDIATAIGAITNRREDGTYDFTYQMARSLCVVGAAAAGVPAIETIHDDFKDEGGLLRVTEEARRAGFRGMLAIHPAQVDPINHMFTPSRSERATAQEIVNLFAANPGHGTIGYRGRMLDLPHLKRAKAVLAQAERA